MAVLDLRNNKAPIPPQYRGGFQGFMHRLMRLGLEAFNLYYGIYRAEVVSNEDPENEGQPDPFGRLTIRVPIVGDDEETTRLAWPIVPIAGSSYGFRSIPPDGGRVYVMFECGRLDAPIWIGGWWAQDEIPSANSSTEQHWWITPGGHKLILDDESGGETITIEHSGGAKIEIDDQGAITIENASGQKVTVGSGTSEAALKGDTLKGLLEDILDAITALTVTTPAGPSGVPQNAAQFISIRAQLTRALSQTVEVA